MELEVSHHFENEQQFWTGKSKQHGRFGGWIAEPDTELDEIVSQECQDSSLIDDALRAYLRVANESRGTFTPRSLVLPTWQLTIDLL
jgi:hypothetical protein